MERLGLVVVSPRRPSVGRRPRSCSWLGPWRSFEAVELATLETGGLVQQPAGLGAHWEHPAGRSRGTPLRYAGAISHGGVTRNGLCQTRRRSVGTKYKDTSLVTDAQITQRQLDAFRRLGSHAAPVSLSIVGARAGGRGASFLCARRAARAAVPDRAAPRSDQRLERPHLAELRPHDRRLR